MTNQSDPAAFRPLPAPFGGPATQAMQMSPLRQPMPVLRPPPPVCVGDIITDGGDLIVTQGGDALCIAPVPPVP